MLFSRILYVCILLLFSYCYSKAGIYEVYLYIYINMNIKYYNIKIIAKIQIRDWSISQMSDHSRER